MEKLSPNEMMKLAEKVYEGLSEEDVEEVERIALDRSNFSGDRAERLVELLKDVTDENLHGEIDFGKSLGKEIL